MRCMGVQGCASEPTTSGSPIRHWSASTRRRPVRAIRVEGFKIGKQDRLAEIDEWAFRLAKKFAPKENEKNVLG